MLLCKVKANGVGQTKNVIKNKQQTDKNKEFSLDIGLRLLIFVVESKKHKFYYSYIIKGSNNTCHNSNYS